MLNTKTINSEPINSNTLSRHIYKYIRTIIDKIESTSVRESSIISRYVSGFTGTISSTYLLNFYIYMRSHVSNITGSNKRISQMFKDIYGYTNSINIMSYYKYNSIRKSISKINDISGENSKLMQVYKYINGHINSIINEYNIRTIYYINRFKLKILNPEYELIDLEKAEKYNWI